MSNVSMLDLAKATNLSRTTVSMVLNGSSEKWRISDETKAKVWDAAKRLGYRKNLIARSMATGKTNVIGVIGLLQHSYEIELLRGISEIVASKNYSVKYFRYNNVLKDDRQITDIVRQCAENRLAGVLCHIDDFSPLLEYEMKEAKVPLLYIDNYFPESKCSCVATDGFSGMIKGVDHLYQLGHRKIAYLSSNLNYAYCKERYLGFREGLRKHNLKFTENQLKTIDFPVEYNQEIKNTATEIFASGVTAACCSGDLLAVALLKAAAEKQISVPKEFSIVGFANFSFTQWLTPALTTLGQQFVEIARVGTKILLAEINGQTKSQIVKLPAELVIRESTGRVP